MQRIYEPKPTMSSLSSFLSCAKESFNLRFQAASGQLENTARVRRVRRDIATIKTIIGEAV